ncbi:MAG: hypothetical protein JST85_18365 [Acidobacteria bacterium]|nr:hypothetical protein [Acidobacteriota bacterium]
MSISASRQIADADVQLDQVIETKEERVARLSVYHEIKRQLIAEGIPENEIAFVHDYDGPAAQAELSRKVNAGEIRIVLASTAKLGVGANIQERLYALHHLDAPWRPADIEQREGRILRQGNLYPEVHICQYVTEGSFDAYSWQILENKTRFIAQIMKGEVTARTAEDVDQAVLTASQIKAIASGNPLVLEKVGLEAEVIRLERLYSTWFAGRNRLRCDLMSLPDRIKEAEADLRAHETAVAARDQHQPVGDDSGKRTFSVALRRSVTEEDLIRYSERELAGNQIRQLAAVVERRAAASGSIRLMLGEYCGFELHASADRPTSIGGTGVDLFGEVGLYLKLKDSHIGYVFNLSDSDAGIIQSMDARLRNLEKRRDESEESFRRLTDQHAKVEAELAKGWEHVARYQELRARLEALNASLKIEGLATDNSLAQIELAEDAFLRAAQAADEAPILSPNNGAVVIASASFDSTVAPQTPDAQIEAPVQTAANINAEAIPVAEETQPHTSKVRDQLLAERKRVEKRKRPAVKASSLASAQMSFEWA